MKRKPIPKLIRQKVYDKYDGHCAYCGYPIEYKDMQVDHISPVYKAEYYDKPLDESLDNLNPSCRMCNFYKSTYTLEGFRKRLSVTLMENLRKSFDYRLALRYGLIKETGMPVIFYYEKGGHKDECHATAKDK